MDGRTVVAVAIDGETITDDELTKLLDSESAPPETMDLQTLDTRELTRGTLTEVLKHLDRLRDGLGLAIEHLGRGERAEALGALRPTLEIWLAVCEAVQKVCVLAQVGMTAKMDDTSVAQLQNAVVNALGDVQSAIEQEDWVKFADLLEYELLPSVDQWETLVNTLRDRIQTDQKA